MKIENIISSCTERVGTKDERVKAGENSRRQEEKTFCWGNSMGVEQKSGFVGGMWSILPIGNQMECVGSEYFTLELEENTTRLKITV